MLRSALLQSDPFRRIVFVVFCACLWQVGLVAPAKEKTAAKTADAPRFEAEISAFESYDHKNAWPHAPVLFVGSSTIRLWQSADAFPDLPIMNRGFGGSTIADVNRYADKIVFKYKPRVIVFYAGDNDIAGGRPADRVFEDFEKFATSVRERLPETSLIFLGIKPSIARWNWWQQMQTVNNRVKELAETSNQIVFVDTAPALLGPDGLPQKSCFREDGLHLSDDGYAAWNKLIAPRISSPTATEVNR